MTASTDAPFVEATPDDTLLQKVSIPKLHGPPMPSLGRYEALSKGTTGPLTVVRGPSGAGKTALVAAWIASDLPAGLVAWLTLDGGDNEPVRFWTAVMEALRRHGVALHADLECPAEPGSLSLGFIEALAEALEYGWEPVVLVLDRLDAITDPRVIRQLGVFVRKASPELRLVVTTRRTPSQVLGRRRVTMTL